MLVLESRKKVCEPVCVCVCVPSAGWSSRCGWSVPVWIPAGSEPGGRSAEGLRSERDARSPRTRSSTWGYLREGDSVCVLHSSYKALFTCITCVCVFVCVCVCVCVCAYPE